MDSTVFRLKEMKAYTKLSRSVIYDRLNESSPRYDPTFPKNFSLGGGAVGWFKKDVDSWLLQCSESGNQLVSGIPATPTSSVATSSIRQQSFKQPKLTQAASSTSATSTPSLGQFMLAGEKLNETMLRYFNLPKWTPVQAALLLSGIIPPAECTEIPASGVGLDSKPLNGGERFRIARDILEDWNDCEILGAEFSPDYSFNWCFDEQISTEWLKLFLELAGCANPDATVLVSSRFAMRF